MMEMLGLLADTERQYDILPQVKGWLAIVVGISMVALGLVPVVLLRRRDDPVSRALTYIGLGLIMIGAFVAFYRTFFEPTECEDWRTTPTGGYCAD